VTESRDSFARFREVLEAIGFRPSSSLGQNFLLDPTLHRVIAQSAGAGEHDVVLEIGVGLGFLTRELAAVAASVVGVEIDKRLFEVASRELAGFPNVQLVRADALGGPGGTIAPEAVDAVRSRLHTGGRLLVVANLPYSVSGPLLAELCCLDPLPSRILVLVQKELGQRLAAPHGTGDYGSLSALCQALYRVRILRDVPPQVFRPRPKVVSALVELVRREDLALPDPAARRSLARFLRALFQQRRKVLRTTLPRACEAAGLELPAHGIDLGLRAEALSPDVLLGLWAGGVARGG
jgi:16S rRNA (adenine1518-N6/adenine1519-N6)-dimethyltransferase